MDLRNQLEYVWRVPDSPTEGSPCAEPVFTFARSQRNPILRVPSDDVAGATNLSASRWYHTAFVFNTVTRNQSIYLDGVLDASRQANNFYQGTNGSLDIGIASWASGSQYFNGLIDQLSFTNRSKTAQEILRDATLTLHFSFDGNSTSDEGPLGINGSLVGNTSFVAGRRGQALQIGNVSDSYLTVRGLVLLGRRSQSYSFSIWIKPASPQRASIIHMSSAANGTGWYIPVIGLTNTSQLVSGLWNGTAVRVTGPVIPTNGWTHAAATYSFASGLRLYTNGSLSNSSLRSRSMPAEYRTISLLAVLKEPSLIHIGRTSTGSTRVPLTSCRSTRGN